MSDLKYRVEDEKTVQIKSIYGSGQVGQIIVLTNVRFGRDDNPLGAFEQPALFTILEILATNARGEARAYRLRHTSGKELVVGEAEEGQSNCDTWWFFDAAEWALYAKHTIANEIEHGKRRVAHVESQRDLLKGILAPKGVHVVSPEQAKALGLKPISETKR